MVSGGPETKYARSEDGSHVAFQVIGDGPLDLVSVGYGNVVSIDMRDEEPHVRRFEERLASFSRLIRFDPRGIGLSDAPPPGVAPGSSWSSTTSSRCSTPSARLGHAFSRSAGAAWPPCWPQPMHPDRVSSLALLNCHARPRDEDYPCGIPQKLLTSFLDSVLDVSTAAGPRHGRCATSRTELVQGPRVPRVVGAVRAGAGRVLPRRGPPWRCRSPGTSGPPFR